MPPLLRDARSATGRGVRLPAVRGALLAPALGAALFAAPFAGSLGAQEQAALAPQWELRLEAPVTPDPGVHAGAGLNVRAGWYARLGVAALAGGVQHDDAWVRSGRLDATARFLLDPFAERRRGLYGGAGFSVRQRGDEAWRGALTLVVGLEGAAEGRAIPAVELALGGGLRITAVWRGRRATGR